MFQFPDKMQKVFLNEEWQQQLEKEGYVIVDYYDNAQIQELKGLFQRLHPVDEVGFFPSTFSKDKNYRIEADKEIRRIGSAWMNKHLKDYKSVCACFITKYPGAESIMPTHQDMTLVDESKYTGINIWCPLVDLDDTNGVLYVIPRSHRIVPTYRGSTIPGLYDDVQKEIMDYMKPVYLKAGQAIIFDQSIIHWSPPNLSNQPRITTNTYFTHKDAEYRICYWQNDYGNQVELFEEDETFMTDFEQFGDNIFERPKIGKSLGLTPYTFPKLTPEWLKQLYGSKESAPQCVGSADASATKEIFQNAELQQLFDKQGFVQIPFLGPAEVQQLVDLFYELHPKLNTDGFQSSSYSDDYKYKKECSDRATAILKPHFEKIFKNYRSFGSAFLYKQPDVFSELPAHQDWTIVDEENYVALNIWIPLCDTDVTNGTLYVLPGSQYGVVKAIRCPTVPMFFEGNEQLMIDHCIPLPTRAGNAVVLNQSVVHYSPPNKSGTIRIAITSGVMNATPKMNFHYRAPDMKDQIEVIEMPDDFLISFEGFREAIYKRPLMGRSIGMRSYVPPVYTREELEALLAKFKDRAGMQKEKPDEVKPKQTGFFRRMIEAIAG